MNSFVIFYWPLRSVNVQTRNNISKHWSEEETNILWGETTIPKRYKENVHKQKWQLQANSKMPYLCEIFFQDERDINILQARFEVKIGMSVTALSLLMLKETKWPFPAFVQCLENIWNYESIGLRIWGHICCVCIKALFRAPIHHQFSKSLVLYSPFLKLKHWIISLCTAMWIWFLLLCLMFFCKCLSLSAIG